MANHTMYTRFYRANILILVKLKCYLGLVFYVKFRRVFQVVCFKMYFVCEACLHFSLLQITLWIYRACVKKWLFFCVDIYEDIVLVLLT